jgi:hypothetical protein
MADDDQEVGQRRRHMRMRRRMREQEPVQGHAPRHRRRHGHKVKRARVKVYDEDTIITIPACDDNDRPCTIQVMLGVAFDLGFEANNTVVVKATLDDPQGLQTALAAIDVNDELQWRGGARMRWATGPFKVAVFQNPMDESLKAFEVISAWPDWIEFTVKVTDGQLPWTRNVSVREVEMFRRKVRFFEEYVSYQLYMRHIDSIRAQTPPPSRYSFLLTVADNNEHRRYHEYANIYVTFCQRDCASPAIDSLEFRMGRADGIRAMAVEFVTAGQAVDVRAYAVSFFRLAQLWIEPVERPIDPNHHVIVRCAGD